MPPTKKRDASDSDSDTSDSGPDDVKPVAKKAKQQAGDSGLRVDDAEDPTWQLDRNRKVTVREFKGKPYIDIREYYEKDGKTLPGKKGISLTPDQFQKIKKIIPEIEEALKNL